MNRFLSATLLAACLSLPLACRAEAPAPTFDDAIHLYERNHWAEAFAAFARLADAGDADAARIALQMHAWGPRLYGQAFELAPERARAWVRLGRRENLAGR